MLILPVRRVIYPERPPSFHSAHWFLKLFHPPALRDPNHDSDRTRAVFSMACVSFETRVHTEMRFSRTETTQGAGTAARRQGRAASEERGRRKVKLSVRRGERSAGQLCNQKALTDAFSIRNPHRSSGGTHRRPAVSIVRHWCWRLQKENVNPTITVAKACLFSSFPLVCCFLEQVIFFFFFPL